MDITNANQVSNVPQEPKVPDVSVQAGQSVAQSAQPVDPGGQTQQAPPTAVSGANREAAPISMPVETAVAVPSEAEPVVAPEVQEAGVEVVTQPRPVITPEQQAIGMQLAKESLPIDAVSAELTHLPLPLTRALQIKKTKTPVTESIRWLAELVIEQVKKAHQTLTN